MEILEEIMDVFFCLSFTKRPLQISFSVPSSVSLHVLKRHNYCSLKLPNCDFFDLSQAPRACLLVHLAGDVAGLDGEDDGVHEVPRRLNQRAGRV